MRVDKSIALLFNDLISTFIFYGYRLFGQREHPFGQRMNILNEMRIRVRNLLTALGRSVSEEINRLLIEEFGI